MTGPRSALNRPAAALRRILHAPRRHARTLVAIVVGVVVLFAAFVGVPRLLHRGVLPGVTVAGIDAGGMSREQLTAALGPVAQAATQDPVTLTSGDKAFPVSPADLSFQPDVAATAARAMAIGRTGNLLSSSWRQWGAFWQSADVALRGDVDRDALDEEITAIAAQVDEPAFPGAVTAGADLTVTTKDPSPGRAVDRETTRAVIVRALAVPGAEQRELPVTVVDPPADAARIATIADQARTALTAPATLTIEGASATATLPPAQLAPLLGLRVGGDGVALGIDPQGLHAAVADAIADQEIPAHDASWNLPDTPPVTFDDKGDATWHPVPVDAEVIPAETGRELDAPEAADHLAAALADGEHHATGALRTVTPAFTTEDARAFGITELVSTFTTYHAPGQPRVTNIHKVADVVDGTRVPAGAQFSINQLTGERSCDKGYRKDGMILNGKLVDVCGGGVSQFGTTTFNAAFFAGVQIDAYKAHSHYISRYPMGREATLNYPSPDIDVRWTNDTGHGIVVKTSYTGSSITVSFYGTSRAAEVRGVTGPKTSYRSSPTQYVEDKSLPPGSSRVYEHGQDGFDVAVTRIITWRDGGEKRRDFHTRYVAVPTVVHRNTSPPPPPKPKPTPTPKPSAGPSPSPKKSPAPTTSPKASSASSPAPASTPTG